MVLPSGWHATHWMDVIDSFTQPQYKGMMGCTKKVRGSIVMGSLCSIALGI